MEKEEAELLAELRALQFTVDKIVISLKALNDITSPGGQLHDSQRKLVQAMSVWSDLFKAAHSAEEDKLEED